MEIGFKNILGQKKRESKISIYETNSKSKHQIKTKNKLS